MGLTRNGWVFLDLMPTLGMTIDLTNLAVPPPATTADVRAGGLAMYPVAHVTFLSAHADATAKAFADVFGITPSAARVEKPVYYPPGSTASAKAYLKTVELKNAGMTVVVAEPVGSPSPASDFVAKNGGLGAYGVAFDVGDKVDEMVAALQAKGGKWTVGRTGGGYAWIDFTDSMGLVIELRGRGK
jgi:hypothetical protein